MTGDEILVKSLPNNKKMDNRHHKLPKTDDLKEDQPLPFVNEECGDTLWEDVLNGTEKSVKTLCKKADESTSEKEEHNKTDSFERTIP